MENYDILIKDCQVLNPDMSVSSTCSVGIKDTWIKKIGSADEFADSVATETLDGKGKLVMPGLIDGHTHTCQQLLRGRVADEYPMVWTRFLVPFESNLLPEDSYVSGQLACLEMIKNGCCFCESRRPGRVCSRCPWSRFRRCIRNSRWRVPRISGKVLHRPDRKDSREAYSGRNRDRRREWYEAQSGSGNPAPQDPYIFPSGSPECR